MIAVSLLLLAAACYGYGYSFARWCMRDEEDSPSYLALIGASCLIFIGGILNLLGKAYPEEMYALLAAGLIGLLYRLKSGFNARLEWQIPKQFFRRFGQSGIALPHAPLLLLLALTAFYLYALVPTEVFNYHDDFNTYFSRPVRMLETGTLTGNPFETLGLDSLGAQAFLQGFVLLNFPIQYISSFDDVFAFALAGLMIIAFGRRFKLHWTHTLLSLLVYVAINPQKVNISSVYTGTLFNLGLFYSSCLLAEAFGEANIAKSRNAALVMGLCIASLFALKTTLAVFAGMYTVMFFLGMLALWPNRRRVMRLGITTLGSSFVAVLPWLLLYSGNYVATIQAASLAEPASGGSDFSMLRGDVAGLFSSNDLFYGGSFLAYGCIVALLAALGACSVAMILRRKDGGIQRVALALPCAVACFAGIGTYFLNGMLFDTETAVRYACPVLLAVLPFALLASSRGIFASTDQFEWERYLRPVARTVVVSGAFVVVVFFWSNFADRLVRANSSHTTISYPFAEDHVKYIDNALSRKSENAMLSIQHQTEPHTKILTWIPIPHQLDYSRNEIESVMEPGLSNPWLKMPLEGTETDMVQYLRNQGVRYILWKYRGIGVKNPGDYKAMLSAHFPIYRLIAQRSSFMQDRLISILKNRTHLYNHDGVVLFDLNQFN